MLNEEAIKKLIVNFLHQEVIYEPQIDAFERKVLLTIKNTKLKVFLRREILKLKTGLKGGKLQVKREIAKVIPSKRETKTSKSKKTSDTISLNIKKKAKSINPKPKVPKKINLNSWHPSSKSELDAIFSQSKNVEELAHFTDKNINWFNKLIEEESILLRHDDPIPKILIDKMKDYWFSRLPDRKQFKFNTGGKSKKSGQSGTGVYDKLKTYGPGKIILIRSK